MRAKFGTKLKQWQKRNKEGLCSKCFTIGKLTIDHIIPITLIKQILVNLPHLIFDEIQNNQDNFQIMCVKCNAKKNSTLDINNPKTIPLLTNLLNVCQTIKTL